ncbi:dipeptidase [Sphingomonas sp. Root710]|uniref:dipeptidase n=1 Tax=Sphingomonas sp. Root710 TaxID=1736594 RepID=UPI0006F8EF40|nr:membrane dipeptidase [Sphingomonas sp. Root710]KRB82239.1 dipeptidase [Sphingomonas sp. Root710]
MTTPFPISRRAVVAGAIGTALSTTMVNRGSFAFAGKPQRYSRRAVDLVASSLVIDMLAPLKATVSIDYVGHRLTTGEAAEFSGSGITGFHHSYGIEGPDARTKALEYIAGWQGFVGRNSDVLTLVDTAEDLDRAKSEGKGAVIMGFQNAEHFDRVEDVALFRKLGLRCAQLTYNSQNRLGSGCTDRVDGGVSDYGAKIIAAMESEGMLVDVSHCGDRTTLDAIALAKGPIAITHSNCRALIAHPRVKTDEAIKALAAKGGVMGITGVRMFVRAEDPTNVGHMTDHIDHVAKLVGVEHVGIGSDADLNGYDDMEPADLAALKALYKKGSYAFRERIDIDGFDHPRKVFDLTEELIRRGYSNDNIRAVLGGNFRRLLGQAWGKTA